MRKILTIACIGVLGFSAMVSAQTYRRDISFSDPNKPGTVKMELWYGDVNVRGAQDKKVVVIYRFEPRSLASSGLASGGRRSDLDISEVNNLVRISRPPSRRDINDPMDVDVQLPVNTNLIVNMRGGNVDVNQLAGSIEVSNQKGNVKLLNLTGSAVVSTVNGGVKAVFNRVNPNAAMSFVSMNGDVDVTLPRATQANVTLQTYEGDISTDFVVNRWQQNAGWGQKVVAGRINKGGAALKLSTINGNIRLRAK